MQYLFKHILMRDAVYDMQLRRRLSELHRQAAEAIEELHASDLAPHYADLVYHYHRAEDSTQERHYAALAGKAEAETGAYQTAVHFLSRALELTPGEDVEGRYDLLLTREEVHHVQGARDAQATDLDALAQLVGLSREGGVQNGGWAAAVTWRQARYAVATSDFGAAIATSQRAVQFAQTADAPAEEAQAWGTWGGALVRQGGYAAAREQFQQGVTAARAAESSVAASAALARNLKGLGNVAYVQGDSTARDYYEQALSIYQEIGDRRGVSNCFINLGLVAALLGDYAAARGYYEQALVIGEEIGYRQGVSLCLTNLGLAVTNLGDYAAARSYYERALAIYEEIGDQYRMGICLNNRGLVAYYLGDHATACSYYEQALAIGEETGDRRGESTCLINLGESAMTAGRYETARGYLRQALNIAQEIEDRSKEGIILNELGALALHQDAPDMANDYYQQASAIRTELDQPHHLVESHAGLAQVALVRGDTNGAWAYAQRVVDYLQENPTLDGAENPMRAFRFSWQVLAALDHPQADDILAMAAQIIQEQVENIIDPAGRKMYLDQPHHRALWEAWQTREAAS